MLSPRAPHHVTGREASQKRPPESDGVEGNARLTGSTAAVLLVLLAAEGVTILRVRSLLSAHVLIGMLLVPPVVLKMASTVYGFARYYSGDLAYREKGPPPLPLRLLGPILAALTLVVFASGIALLFVGVGLRHSVLFIHKASFVLWFGSMTIHVLAHLGDTARLAPRDFYHATRRQVRGAGARQWMLALSIVVGMLLGLALVGRVGRYLAI